MLPFTSTLSCNGLNLRNNFNGLLGDLRSNQMLLGVNSNPVTTLLQPNPGTTVLQPNSVQLAMNVNNTANKDSQWLTLEVCREFQRSMCPRNELECKYAHPPPYIETQNGRVMCCYDSIKGKCHRIKPPCKYLHPPQHLKDLLIQNGKNNLLMKNLQMNILQQQLSSLSGNSQSRLGFLSMNNSNSKIHYSPQLHSPSTVPLIAQKSGNENQKFPSTVEQTDSTASSDQNILNKSIHDNFCMSNDAVQSQINSNRFSNFYDYQLTQCLPNNNSPGVPISITTTPSDVNSVDSKTSRKRPLQTNNSTSNKTEQSSEKPVPIKKLNLLDPQFSGINREHQSNQLGFMINNPLMTYQNQLASLLSMNNQSGLQSNTLNLQALLASNNGSLLSMGPSMVCPNTLINVNGIPMISTMPTQQQFATTLLQAANALQYNRSLTDFSGFQ